MLEALLRRLGYVKVAPSLPMWSVIYMDGRTFELGRRRGYWNAQGDCDWIKLGHDIGRAVTSYVDRQPR